MGISSMCVLPLSVFTLLLFEFTHSAVIMVDGVSQWKNPQVQIGDSVVFQHKYHYNLYIFKNQRAFTLCNFSQATVLTKPGSTSYTWHVSRPGFFYFSFNNGTNKACLQGQKLAVEVSLAAPPPIPIPPSVEAPHPSPVESWPLLRRFLGLFSLKKATPPTLHQLCHPLPPVPWPLIGKAFRLLIAIPRCLCPPEKSTLPLSGL